MSQEFARRPGISVVLVVDPDQQPLAAFASSVDNVEVIAATTGSDALLLVTERTPGLVVVELRLGAESGIELIRQLKALRPELIVVLASSYLSIVSAVAALRAGADEILQKPVTLREILRRVQGDEPASDGVDETPTLARVEWEYIMRVLHDCGGNLSEAARRLGIYRSTLKRRLRKQPG